MNGTLTMGTTARPASTSVERSRGPRMRAIIVQTGAGWGRRSGGGGEIGPADVIEDTRPLHRLGEDGVGAGLPGARDIGLAVPRDHDEAGGGARGAPDLPDQRVARD